MWLKCHWFPHWFPPSTIIPPGKICQKVHRVFCACDVRWSSGKWSSTSNPHHWHLRQKNVHEHLIYHIISYLISYYIILYHIKSYYITNICENPWRFVKNPWRILTKITVLCFQRSPAPGARSWAAPWRRKSLKNGGGNMKNNNYIYIYIIMYVYIYE